MAKAGESKPMRVIFGNDLNVLAECLGEEIFSPASPPFESRLIAVPDISAKEFLIDRFIAHPRLKMVAGVQILPLNRAVMEIIDRTFLQRQIKKKLPSSIELSLAIEEKLHQILAEKKEHESLIRYLDTGLEGKSRRRISSLSDELAKLFGRYGLYGASFLPQWLAEKNQGWQQSLWRELFSDPSPWTYPLKALAAVDAQQFRGKISLFGFSYIAPVHLSFFASSGASLYQLSPCALFWEDSASDKQRLFMSKALRQKKVKESSCEEIDRYMQQSHPLLGNWGKLGKEMLKSLHGFELIEEEVYREPPENSLLADLKRSLLTLDETPPIDGDDSIQLHSATSRLREVEVMRDALEALLHAHAQKTDLITPREILVVSPDIGAYAPYIQMVFSQSPLPYAIEGVSLLSTSQAVQGFMQLLKLREERFALPSLMKLLHSAPFADKNGFTHDEIDQLGRWFHLAEIQSGISSHPNSWEAGIDRLLYGLARIPTDGDDFEMWPVAGIPQSEIDLFNRFLELFEKIKKDLSSLAGEKNAGQWFELFVHMGDTYFHLEWEKQPFFQELKNLSLSCRALKRDVWDFASIERVLVRLAQKPVGEIPSPQLQKMRCTTLRHGSLKAARILWCLGMDEGVFPRADLRSSLCEMSLDYYPSKSDEDRTLFLDLFIKTGDYLIFSYRRVHPEDGKQQGPSILIEELNQYLIKRGLGAGIQKIDHPILPPQSGQFIPPSSPKPFFDLKPFQHSDQAQEMSIDIRQLKKLARHPLQFYFNEALKIYLEEGDDEEEKEFLVSHLRKSILRKKALKTPLPQVMRRLRAEGKLPSGLFQDVAWQDLEEEVGDLLDHFKAFGIHSDEVKTIHFSPSVLDHEKKEMILPPLSISLAGSRKVHIIGKLEDVTPKGLLFHGDDDLKSLVKVWPLYLIYRCLSHENTKLLLTKKGKEIELPVCDVKAALASYVEYFLLAKNTPSPLMPDWAEALLQKEEIDLAKAMSKDFVYEDAYLNYLNRRQGLFDPKEIFALWSEPLRRTFSVLVERGKK